ncbi:MAG: hypothetical protein ABIT71_16825 [Vicinamibacteraceae bacterium]
MLQIDQLRWFSWDFTVSRDGRRLAELDISCWRERGVLSVDGASYAITREGFMSGDFRLTGPDNRVIASASKPSLLRRRFEIVHGGRTWTLQPRSAWGRAMTLLVDGRDAGAITPAGAWTRRASASLPDTLPLPVQVFIVWLAVLLWKRDQDAAAAAS